MKFKSSLLPEVQERLGKEKWRIVSTSGKDHGRCKEFLAFQLSHGLIPSLIRRSDKSMFASDLDGMLGENRWFEGLPQPVYRIVRQNYRRAQDRKDKGSRPPASRRSNACVYRKAKHSPRVSWDSIVSTLVEGPHHSRPRVAKTFSPSHPAR
jgi:hypothetical protein